MKKITLFYLSIVLFVTFASFFYQKMNGAIYLHEWYENEYSILLRTTGNNADTSGYDKMMLDIAKDGSNTLDPTERYALTSSSETLKDLQWLNWSVILFIVTFPLLRLKQYSRYKEVFLSIFVALSLGFVSGMADLMDWFGGRGEWSSLEVAFTYFIVFPGILLIEMIGIFVYVSLKMRSQKSAT